MNFCYDSGASMKYSADHYKIHTTTIKYILFITPVELFIIKMFGDLFSQHYDYQKGIIYQGRRKFLVSKEKNVLEPPPEFKTRKQSMRSTQKAKLNTEILPPIIGIEAPPQLVNVIINTKNSFLNLRNNSDFKSKRNIKTGTTKPMIIQHYSSVDRRDWEEQIQAGCHIYVNKNTGEVSVECPWHGSYAPTPKSVKLQSRSDTLPVSTPPLYNSPNKGIKLDPLPNSSYNSPEPNTSSSIHQQQQQQWSGGSVTSLNSLGISSGRYHVYDDKDDLGTGSLVYDRSELDDMLSLLDDSSRKQKRSSIKNPDKLTPIN